MRVLVLHLIDEMRKGGVVANLMLVFPARRELKAALAALAEREAENAELRTLRDRVETNVGYLASCVDRSRTYS